MSLHTCEGDWRCWPEVHGEFLSSKRQEGSVCMCRSYYRVDGQQGAEEILL